MLYLRKYGTSLTYQQDYVANFYILQIRPLNICHYSDSIT